VFVAVAARCPPTATRGLLCAADLVAQLLGELHDLGAVLVRIDVQVLGPLGIACRLAGAVLGLVPTTGSGSCLRTIAG
jgi:hypothetical protein